MLRRQTLLYTMVFIVYSHAAAPQGFDDAGVCSRLLQSFRSGLYLAYPAFAGLQPNGRTICEQSHGYCVTPVNGRASYNPSARFYFIPQNTRGRAEEWVWHIRTQTRAANLSGADFAFVYRPRLRTRCSENSLLDAFSDNRRLVPLNRYMDHHHGPNDPVRRDPSLGRYFHFQIQDSPDTRECVKTDDPRVFRNLRSIYGFDEVIRTEQQVARMFYFTGTAVADVATRHAGLSSEFAYHDGVGPVCFGFTAPVPTRSGNFDPAREWKPQQTSIVIKRLRGRQVLDTAQRTVTWAQ